ncbi:MAG: hypothetical protein IPF79_05785 [Ignavibacteria bacterium]|nr:hypothetical protein [Ignavibacteria bacterium]
MMRVTGGGGGGGGSSFSTSLPDNKVASTGNKLPWPNLAICSAQPMFHRDYFF